MDIYSVSRVTSYLRALLESDPLLSDLWIRGEISNWVRVRSGHCYFTLKDEEAEIRCIMWHSAVQLLSVLPRDGDEVVAAGYVSVYPERGRYQFYVAEMQPLGLGALYKRFEALKAALAIEGLFDEVHKRPLPTFPRRIGIVTSPTAAALQDVLNVLRRRHPLVHVLLSPTLVQGSDAPEGIVRALRRFEQASVDLVIVARGGGSIEDLWAFNEEVVARAIHACSTPIISGVGHEIDFTIADLVADRRAPTPSAAAELAVPDIREWRDRLHDRIDALDDAMDELFRSRRRQVAQEVRALERSAPERRLREQRQNRDYLAARLDRALTNYLKLQRSNLVGLQGRLATLDPRGTLARGYAVVADCKGLLLRHAADVAPGQRVHVTLEEGEFEAVANAGSTPGA
ncbi:MAG: exodeoxyribonuclease VII large subunit [Chloroflexota bacterium]|nr:exodeoxyribonuclease VII large subunit [Chloroflexota bacterium]